MLGANGMLGSEILSKFSEEKNVEILPCYRSLLEVDNYGRYKARFQKLVSDYRPDYVINCVVINHRRRTISGVMQQMVVNGIFPRFVAKQSKIHHYFMVQVSTDGVFFGKKGGYVESSRRYPRNLYSLSKIIGEVRSESVLIIRCSIIGKTKVNHKVSSLLTWFANQKQNSSVDGYTNHLWNGVTTDYLAKLISGIVNNGYKVGGVQHFIPVDVLAKSELLELFRRVLHRLDIAVRPIPASQSLRRNLSTQYPDKNQLFWRLTGLPYVPSISELLNRTFPQ